MKNVPNALTIFRIALAPVFIYAYFSRFANNHIIALSIFLLASLTDVLDGYIARKFNASSKLGIALDPFADKLMLLSVLGSFYLDNLIPGILFFIMLAVESVMMVSGAFLYFKKDFSVIPSNMLGKTATLAFTLAVVITFVYPSSSISLSTVALSIILKTAAFLYYMIRMLHMVRNT